MLSLFILICALCATGSARPSLDWKRSAPRIIGGQDATNGQFPWQLSLEYLGKNGWLHTCGAALIHSYYALTSAQCVDGINVQSLRIVAGMYNRADSGTSAVQTILLNSFIMHENYQPMVAGIPNDLAVIRLGVAADTARPTIKIANLPPDDSNTFTHNGCFMSGWGRNDTSMTYTKILQWIQIPTITNTECTTELQGIDNANVFDTHICSFSSSSEIGGCNGDGGSPLICYPSANDLSVQYLAGVVSWFATNVGNCNAKYPTVSTRVSKYLDWISANTP